MNRTVRQLALAVALALAFIARPTAVVPQSAVAASKSAKDCLHQSLVQQLTELSTHELQEVQKFLAMRRTGVEVKRLGTARIARYSNETGEQVLRFEHREGGSWVSAGQISVDPQTSTWFGQEPGTRQVLHKIVKGLARLQSKRGSGVIVLDVNDLGKVNYFHGNQVAGDTYLNAVARAIKKSVREGDIVARIGGDEFMVIADEVDSRGLTTMKNKIREAVRRDPEAVKLFDEQHAFLKDQQESMQKLGRYEDLLASPVAKTLTAAELDAARTAFPEFKRAFLKVRGKKIDEMEKMGPSVSPGGRLIRKTDTYESVVADSSAEAAKVKIQTKAARGDDISKYTSDILGEMKKNAR